MLTNEQIKNFLSKAEYQAAIAIIGLEIKDLIPVMQHNIERENGKYNIEDRDKALQKLLFDILVDTIVDFYVEPHLNLTEAQAKTAYKWAKDEALDVFTNHTVNAEDHIARIRENGKNLFRNAE